MENESFKYYAFISYSHKDKKIAKKLQKHLEHYHLPSALRKTNPDLPKNLSPVFIDEIDLVARGTLKTGLQANLDRSNYIILICSPSSAKSEYVNDEIDYFIKIGRGDHIIPLIVDGEPHSKDPSKECFPPAILELPREKELLGIDINVFGVYGAFLRVIATLLKLDLDDFIARDAKERKRKNIIFISIFAAVLIIAVILIPPPYDETYAENIMLRALSAYVRTGSQYRNIQDLTECAINNPSRFDNQLALYKNDISSVSVMSGKSSVEYLSDMMKTGKVMPWSRKPMEQHECEELFLLADNREDEYKLFVSVLIFVMNDDYAKRYYASQYTELLHGLLEIDADIAAELYQIVCSPHLAGKFADNSTMAQSFNALFTSVPKQNAHLTGEDVKQAKESLERLRGTRSEALSKLNSCGVFEAYNSANPVVVTSGDIHSESEDKTAKPEDKAETRILNDLLAYIYSCEVIYSDLQWALDYFENFDRERSWESLQLARASITIAKLYITRRKLPAPEMTTEDQREFMNRGIDLSFMENLDSQFNAEQAALITTCNALTKYIMYEVFMKDNWEICMRDVANDRKVEKHKMQYLANTVDWVLTSINNPEATQKFNDLLEKHCPKTRAHQRKNPESLEKIEASTHALLNQLEDIHMEKTKILGAKTNILNSLKNAIEKKDADFIRKNIMAISNMPPCISPPKWIIDGNIHYFWNENGERTSTMKPHTKLERVPDTCYITIQGITLDQVKEYQKKLEEEGITCLGTKEEDEKYTVLYKIKDSRFGIIWDTKKVSIIMTQNPVCFIPDLYLPYILKIGELN